MTKDKKKEGRLFLITRQSWGTYKKQRDKKMN